MATSLLVCMSSDLSFCFGLKNERGTWARIEEEGGRGQRERKTIGGKNGGEGGGRQGGREGGRDYTARATCIIIQY